MPPHKPRVLAILPGFTASTIMDVVQPLLKLETAGKIDFRVALEFYTTMSAINWASLLVFCRNTEPKYQYILDSVLNNNTPYIYDLDDNLFEIPADTELGYYHRSPKRLEQLKRYLRNADLVRVYSQPLHTKILELNPNTNIMMAPLDWTLIKTPSKKPSGERVKMTYVTSRIDDRLFSIFSQALLQVLREFQDKTVMTFWGYLPSEFQGIPNVHYQIFVPNYNTFMKRFSQTGFDIGLAPLYTDDFHRSKTNNKFREYGACNIAGIYSNVDVYASCVEDSKTGLLVSNDPDSWYVAMTRLINDDDLRTRIAQTAKKSVQQQYSKNQFQNSWWQQIQLVLTQNHRRLEVKRETYDMQSSYSSVTNGRSLHPSRAASRRQQVISLLSFRPKELFSKFRLQLYNWWLLFKINQLRHL